ncbi:hypothetical protein Mal15_42240 [Stieleria maiorica]|uniref:Uncharacterized protein n=1 Tax=Stieleria maiorica TaxID=2795974 RepID=A0A5B9MKI0_9BACT|nr:hypothetical protein Mal15_42240 [Stieleria maiorica]
MTLYLDVVSVLRDGGLIAVGYVCENTLALSNTIALPHSALSVSMFERLS